MSSRLQIDCTGMKCPRPIIEVAKAAATYQRYEQLFGPSLDVGLALARVLEAQARPAEACRKYMELSFAASAMAPETQSLVQEKIQTLCRAGVN